MLPQSTVRRAHKDARMTSAVMVLTPETSNTDPLLTMSEFRLLPGDHQPIANQPPVPLEIRQAFQRWYRLVVITHTGAIGERVAEKSRK